MNPSSNITVGFFERGPIGRFNINEHESNQDNWFMGLNLLYDAQFSHFFLMWDLHSHLDSQQSLFQVCECESKSHWLEMRK